MRTRPCGAFPLIRCWTLDVERWTLLAMNETEQEHEQTPEQEKPHATGVANPAAIDLFAFDSKNDQVLLVMNETRPWDGSDRRLHQLQEKFNAYVSFLLDGELATEHPELAGKRARIELHTASMPDERAIELARCDPRPTADAGDRNGSGGGGARRLRRCLRLSRRLRAATTSSSKKRPLGWTPAWRGRAGIRVRSGTALPPVRPRLS